MKEISVAGNYARAFFEVAQEKAGVTACREELKTLAKLLRADKRLEALLRNPYQKLSDKWAALYERLDAPISDITVNFIKLLINNKRIYLLPLIADLFIRKSETSRDSERINLITARPLEFTERLEFERVFGRSQFIDYTVDSEILAGAVVRKGSKLLDLSARGRLKKFEKYLEEESCR